MMMKTSLAALAAIAFATSASASTSADPFVQDKAILQLKGLDLSTPDGQQRLAIRMDQAARSVCGNHLSSIHLSLEAQARECRVAVLAHVRAQIEARTADAANSPHTRFASTR
jgi:UrcA family protein